MSSGDWKTISTRCKTGFFQEIASNTQVSCNNSQALQPPAIGIPNFCIMLYTGPVVQTTFATLRSTGVTNAFCNNTNSELCDMPCTVPCQAAGGNPSVWQDWYVLDEFLAQATSQLLDSTYPQTVDTTGAVGMGIAMNDYGVTSGTIGVMEGMRGPYGSIDISFGIVPLHTHDIENKGITQVPGPDTVAAALYTEMPELNTIDVSLNIEHYHALPAIYLSNVMYKIKFGEEVDGNKDNYQKTTLYTATEKDKKSEGAQYFTRTYKNGSQYLFDPDKESGAIVYAMGNAGDLNGDAKGAGYTLGEGLPKPFPQSCGFTLDNCQTEEDCPYKNGMTWRNWQRPLNYETLMDDQSITIPSLTVPAEDIPIDAKPDVSCNDWFGVDEGVANPDNDTAWRDNGKIVVDISLDSVLTTVDDYTNVATFTQSEDGLLSSGVVDNVETLEDLGGNMNDDTDIPSQDGNLGYRSFGAFYIIYYPQIGTL